MKIRKTKLNHLAPSPLYVQVRENIRKRILERAFAANDKLPSEADLIEEFGVSRITIRQALNDLAKEGMLYSIAGKGTYVSGAKISQDVTHLQGFGEAMSVRGFETSSKLLSLEFLPAEQKIADRLKCRIRTTICEIKRVRFLEKEPVSLDITYVSQEVGEMLRSEDLSRHDIFVLLESRLNIRLTRAELEIEAALATADIANLLHMQPSAPVMRVERLVYSEDGPIDFEYLYYKGESYRYRMEVVRSRK